MSMDNHKKDKEGNLSSKLSHNKLSHNENIEKKKERRVRVWRKKEDH